MALSARTRHIKALRNSKKAVAPDSDEFRELDRQYQQSAVADRVEQLLANAPSFTPEQIGKLTILLASRGVAA